jgi:Family of unknown function (DUF6461)
VSSSAAYRWIEETTESTLALFSVTARSASELLAPLGSLEPRGSLTYAAALELQGSFYDDGTFDRRAVIQAERLVGSAEAHWVTVEPNGFQADRHLTEIAGDAAAASLFWNVNAVMRLKRAESGRAVVDFDPLIDRERIPPEATDLPFESTPMAASMALIERWTGVRIEQRWFLAAKPTFVVNLAVIRL